MSPAKLAPTDTRVDISRIDKYAPAELIGREDEIKLLNDAWFGDGKTGSARRHVVTFVALGGEGKTSLVAKWAAELAGRGWPQCSAAFAWSFYSQGTREQVAASSDLFLKEALTFFGDDADKLFAESAAGAFEKGQRLARLVGARRNLLVLDGLEPLQYAPTSPMAGEFKDQGIAALLKGLAANSHGLCVVTTRYSVANLKAFWQSTAPEVKLLRLSRAAGVHLLKKLGVKGSEQRLLSLNDGQKGSEKVNEFEKLVEDVKGHALTLNLLGGFLKRAFQGDIRRRDCVKFEKADEKMDGGHAFRTMEAYERWLVRDGGEEGQREVAVLRLLGLFDRPADAGCLLALRRDNIPGLTDPLEGLAEHDWEFCLSGLEAANLLTVNRDPSGAVVSLDAHPHLREYFAQQVRAKTPDAWCGAHCRLYEHLCVITKEGDRPTLQDLQPLYQAVAHGCQAGLQQAACDRVFFDRIRRKKENYSSRKLGAHGSDLGALACFFSTPWTRVSTALTERDQSWVLGTTSFALNALGRLTEALDPMEGTLKMELQQNRHEGATIITNNLGELKLALGEIGEAEMYAERSVAYADQSGNAFHRATKRAMHANVLHQAGRRIEAENRFREAEQMQAQNQASYAFLYSLPGFEYCDLLLANAERAAWQEVSSRNDSQVKVLTEARLREVAAICSAVSGRAAQTLKWAIDSKASLLSVALDHLTRGRSALYAVVLGYMDLDRHEGAKGAPVLAEGLNFSAASELNVALEGLRDAAQTYHILQGLLTRAWLRFLFGAAVGPGSAQEDLDEAGELAERGPMKLFMADIYLYRARLFGGPKARADGLTYPWTSPQADLKAARVLIEACGYWRRKEELEDAERALIVV